MIVEGSVLTQHQAIFLKRSEIKPRFPDVRLAFEREGGGGGGSWVKTAEMNHLRLALGCEGGSGGGSRVKTTRKTTSSSHLDVREVVVVGVASK